VESSTFVTGMSFFPLSLPLPLPRSPLHPSFPPYLLAPSSLLPFFSPFSFPYPPFPLRYPNSLFSSPLPPLFSSPLSPPYPLLGILHSLLTDQWTVENITLIDSKMERWIDLLGDTILSNVYVSNCVFDDHGGM
jgi:hypothetical protein